MSSGFRVVLFLVVIGIAVPRAGASQAFDDVQLLRSSPACAHQRLGQVSVHLGSKEPNPRTGTAPGSVSYRQGFERLRTAARERGGNAVVLRGHEAAYFTKGARQARRPTYLSLQGAVISLDKNGAACPLARIDPAEYQREAMGRQRADIVQNKGVSF